MGPRGRPERVCSTENLVPPAEFERRAVQPVASRSADWANLAFKGFVLWRKLRGGTVSQYIDCIFINSILACMGIERNIKGNALETQ